MQIFALLAHEVFGKAGTDALVQKTDLAADVVQPFAGMVKDLVFADDLLADLRFEPLVEYQTAAKFPHARRLSRRGIHRLVAHPRGTEQRRDVGKLLAGEHRALRGAFQTVPRRREVFDLPRAEAEEKGERLRRERKTAARLRKVVRGFQPEHRLPPALQRSIGGRGGKDLIKLQPHKMLLHSKLLFACPRLAPARGAFSGQAAKGPSSLSRPVRSESSPARHFSARKGTQL